MDSLISPDGKRKLTKALTTCGRCRLKLDALANADLPVDEEFAKLDRTEKAIRVLLELDNPGADRK